MWSDECSSAPVSVNFQFQQQYEGWSMFSCAKVLLPGEPIWKILERGGREPDLNIILSTIDLNTAGTSGAGEALA